MATEENRNAVPESRTAMRSIRKDILPSIFGVAQGEKIKRPASATILKSPEEIYAFIRDFRNLALIFKGVKSVSPVSETRFRWSGDSTFGLSGDWETEIIAEKANEGLAWQTVEKTIFKQSGAFSLEPAPGGRGTVVSLKIVFDHQPAQLAALLGKLSAKDPDVYAKVTIRRVQAYLETGECPTVDGQPTGRDEDTGDDLRPYKH